MAAQLITKEVFLSELTKELEYLKDGGTPYRIKTAELSLFVAHCVDTVELFFNLEETLKKVKLLLPDADPERIKDVSEMLKTISRYLNMQANLSENLKLKLQERKKKRKS